LRVAFASAPPFLQRTPADSATVRTSRLDGRNPEINFKGEKLSNVTHQSTDHKAQLSMKGVSVLNGVPPDRYRQAEGVWACLQQQIRPH